MSDVAFRYTQNEKYIAKGISTQLCNLKAKTTTTINVKFKNYKIVIKIVEIRIQIRYKFIQIAIVK